MIAYTKYPNTPESDAMDEVMHIVETPDGKVEVMATDPTDAIEKINQLRRRMENVFSNR
jgi:hypothetical protein